MRRLMYFGAGAVAALWARRRLVAAVDHYTPVSIRDAAVGRARRLGGDVRAAVDDGRAAMAERERLLHTPSSERARVRRPRPAFDGAAAAPARRRPELPLPQSPSDDETAPGAGMVIGQRGGP
jgi:hypothetical protein